MLYVRKIDQSFNFNFNFNFKFMSRLAAAAEMRPPNTETETPTMAQMPAEPPAGGLVLMIPLHTVHSTRARAPETCNLHDALPGQFTLTGPAYVHQFG